MPKRLIKYRTLLILTVLLLALFGGVSSFSAQASSCSAWFRCPITQYFEQKQEHGVDLATHGLPITALIPGTITYNHWQCWSGECVQDVTWKLDHPACHNGRCEPYAYVQIANSRVRIGQHVQVGTLLGGSGSFIEFGLTPDWAYGVSNWRWGIDPRFLL